MTLRRRFALCLLAVVACAALNARAAAPPLEERLAELPRWGTIVYVTAHPDDESAAIITYLARGLHARVVVLAATRGEGGQNQSGPELGEEMAVVRTRELQAAVAGYGAEVRFLGALDFGYSKSVEETLRVWGEEKVVGELVRQIRLLRPLAVISHWSDQAPAGAHHQAAGILTRRAVPLAGDPNAFPEQLAHGLAPWQPRYFLLRSYNPEEKKALPVPVDNPSPVAGKTYEELGWDAFRNHRSQGMDQIDLSQVRFLRRYFLRVEDVLPEGVAAPVSVAELAPDLAALPDLFPSVEFAAARGQLGDAVKLAGSARQLLSEDKRGEAALALVQGAALVNAVARDLPVGSGDQETSSARALLEDRRDDFLRTAAALAGVELEALTDRAVVAPGDRVWVRTTLKAKDPEVFHAAGFELSEVQLVAPEEWAVSPWLEGSDVLKPNAAYESEVHIPASADPQRGPYPALRARVQLRTGRLLVTLDAPVRGLALGGAAEARVEPVSLAPAVTLAVTPPLRLVRASAGETTYDLWVRVENNRPEPGNVSVWLNVPTGWYTPLPQKVELAPGGAAGLRFALTIPGGVAPGNYDLEAVAGLDGRTFRLARHQRLDAFGDTRPLYEPAETRVELLDADVPPGLRVGYIGFNNDPVPALLGQLGVGVDMLDERQLAAARLDAYDAIIIANRAYDYRDDLPGQNARLLDFVKAGGTLLVEHQGRGWDPAKFAPYPGAKSGNLRVTVEGAPVRVLAPDHPLLNFPNRIGPADWQGWVQERGLYFWESWAPEYTPLLEMADPGEAPLGGALLYARAGDGAYIYCGLALFRQVRAGVPGGVRLYLNLLSQRRAAQPSGTTTAPEK